MMITLISFSRFYCWLITSVFGFQKPDAAAPTHSLQQDLRMLGPSFAATWVYKTADAVVYNRFLVFVQTRFCFCFWRKSIGLRGVDCALILSPSHQREQLRVPGSLLWAGCRSAGDRWRQWSPGTERNSECIQHEHWPICHFKVKQKKGDIQKLLQFLLRYHRK